MTIIDTNPCASLLQGEEASIFYLSEQWYSVFHVHENSDVVECTIFMNDVSGLY